MSDVKFVNPKGLICKGLAPGIRQGINLLHYSEDGNICEHCFKTINKLKEEWTDSAVMHEDHPKSCIKQSVD